MNSLEQLIQGRTPKPPNTYCGEKGMRWYPFTYESEYETIEMEWTKVRGQFMVSLFGHSYCITYPKNQPLTECLHDVIANYKKYEIKNFDAWYRAWCD